MNTARAILGVSTVSAASSQPLFLVLLLASRLVVLALLTPGAGPSSIQGATRDPSVASGN